MKNKLTCQTYQVSHEDLAPSAECLRQVGGLWSTLVGPCQQLHRNLVGGGECGGGIGRGRHGIRVWDGRVVVRELRVEEEEGRAESLG